VSFLKTSLEQTRLPRPNPSPRALPYGQSITARSQDTGGFHVAKMPAGFCRPVGAILNSGARFGAPTTVAPANPVRLERRDGTCSPSSAEPHIPSVPRRRSTPPLDHLLAEEYSGDRTETDANWHLDFLSLEPLNAEGRQPGLKRSSAPALEFRRAMAPPSRPCRRCRASGVAAKSATLSSI
jgi:hypothetical protein